MVKRALAILTILIGLIAALNTEKVRMVIIQTEPFSMETESDHIPCGASIDYWKEYLAPRMGIELDILGPVSLERAKNMIETGEADVLTQIVRTKDRESLFHYPETPLAEITPGIVVAAESKIREIRSPKDLSMARIGYAQGSYIPSFLVANDITLDLIPFANYREMNLKKLFANRLDALFEPNTESMRYYLAKRELLEKVRFLELPVEKLNLYSVFGKTETGLRLAREFDRLNRIARDENIYAGFFKEYF
jgi:ABC-type amino acid transport substrate-binding protein